MSIRGYNIATPTAKPARSRFTDPVALRNVYDRLTDDDAPEAARRAKLYRLYDGFLPHDPKVLESCGLKNIANVNFLGLKGTIDNRADAILKLSSDTTNLIELRPLAREVAGPDAVRIAQVVAEEFSTIAREEGRMIPAISMMNKEADLYGIGPITWTSSEDYNPVALARGQIRFIGDGPVISKDHELIMFETTLQASYLFYLLDHEESAMAEGWDIAAIKEWIVRVFANNEETAANPGVEGSTSAIEAALSLIRQNRFEEEHQFDRLKVIHAFVKEMEIPRGITHLIMPATEQKRFMFRKQNAYETMDECFLWFPYSCNVKYAKEVRGLASFLYPIEQLNNRFTCQMVDVGFRAASFILSQKTAGSQQQLTINEQGPYTFIPQEFVPAQSQVAPNFQQLAQLKQLLDGIGVNSVTGSDKGPLASTGFKLQQGSDRQTKAEVELQNRLRSHKEEALFIQRMSTLDKVFRESFRRFIKLALDPDATKLIDYPEIRRFIDRCARRNVTMEHLALVPSMFTVATCRDLILGSEGKVGVLADVLSTFGGNLDEPGRRAATRDIIQLRLGTTAADKYAPEQNRDQLPSDSASIANGENNDMRAGQKALAGYDQNHWAHIPVHAQLLQEIVEQVAAPEDNGAAGADESIGEQTLQNTGNDPRGMLQMLVMCSQHIQEHLQYGGTQLGMEGQVKQVQKMIRDLRPTIKALNLAVATQERVEQAQREQAERDRQAELDKLAEEKAQVARIEADKKAETDRYKIDREHEVAMHKLDLEREVAGAQTARDDQTTAANIARADAESEARVTRDQKLNDAKVNAANAVNRMNLMNEGTGYPATSPAEVSGDEFIESL